MYKVSKIIKKFEKSKEFTIENTDKIADDFSVTFITLKNGRDPSENGKVNEINDGYGAIYIVKKGMCNFNLYKDNKTEKIVLNENEYIHFQSHLEFDIEGDCILILICMPAYSDKMYSHPDKPLL